MTRETDIPAVVPTRKWRKVKNALIFINMSKQKNMIENEQNYKEKGHLIAESIPMIVYNPRSKWIPLKHSMKFTCLLLSILYQKLRLNNLFRPE